jgi:hypothetical protein
MFSPEKNVEDDTIENKEIKFNMFSPQKVEE